MDREQAAEDEVPPQVTWPGGVRRADLAGRLGELFGFGGVGFTSPKAVRMGD